MKAMIPSQNLNERLDAFRAEMFAKFKRVEHKHRGNSVTDDEVDWLTFDWEKIRDHFWEEVEELRKSPTDDKECVDIANMAFLLWWFNIQNNEAVSEMVS